MKNIIYNIMCCMALVVSSSLSSCSNDGTEEKTARGSKHILTLDVSIDDFSETTSRSGGKFTNGDKVYIKLGSSKLSATYNGSQWTISDVPESLADNAQGSCEVYYDDSGLSSSSSRAVFATTSGSYSNTSSELSVSGKLTPATSRVHFRGTAGTKITVQGLKCITQFNTSTYDYSYNTNAVSLTVANDGYTPYVYCVANNGTLKITNGNYTYSRTFGSNVLAVGKSGYIDIPTDSKHSGWSSDESNNIDISADDYGSDVDWNQQDKEPTQSTDTPVNGYDNDENWNATYDNGHEYVDLGLSVKWATMNVGALKPEGYGHYFAWGEVYSKKDYSWSTYKWCNGTYYSLTKYCTDSSYGTVDNKTTLDKEDDVASVRWGGKWRMPTDAEMTELRTKCTWTWTSVNGFYGYKVTGPNGNSIFLPAAGCRSSTNHDYLGSYGYYWSSSLCSSESYRAFALGFTSSIPSPGVASLRLLGYSIRPVSQN